MQGFYLLWNNLLKIVLIISIWFPPRLEQKNPYYSEEYLLITKYFIKLPSSNLWIIGFITFKYLLKS